MIEEHKIQEIIEANDIIETIEQEGIKLKKFGKTYKTCCPFHNEKTPSFIVYPESQNFVCFGCGEKGDVVDFIMKHKNLSFPDAIHELADKKNITIKENKPSPEAQKIHDEKETILKIYEIATRFYESILEIDEEKKQYAENRFTKETIKKWSIGSSSSRWNDLYSYLRSNNIEHKDIINSGLCRNGEHGTYDFFRERLMFPIKNKQGKTIAFSARIINSNNNSPKYINSSENIVYQKKKTLFGLNFAWREIKKYDVCVIVEGNADVIKLHEIGIQNVVAACGTALNVEQIEEIGKYTKKICLLYDSDNAGQNASKKNAELILSLGYNVLILNIPPDEQGNKQDPDSFFTSKEQFAEYYTNNKIDYIIAKAKSKAENCNNDPVYKSKTIKELTQLFYKKSDSEVNILINDLSKIIPNTSNWKNALKELRNDDTKKEKIIEENGRTNEQNKQIEKYGFYIEKNCYYFQKESGTFFKGSNFILEPLFHIESVINAKRLFKVTNEYGVEKVLEFPQKDLISITAFKLRCESCGNFRFDAGESGLAKIKALLYEQTKTCIEITQLGWQKQNFFAWSNGIVENGKFTETTKEGICKHDGQNFYLPALSSFYESDDMLFQFERKFKHKPGTITIQNWIRKFYQVYGENALIGFAYYCATLFRDIIVNQFRFFPILNIFGPKGTGKSEMAISLTKLFGDLPVGLNMTNSTLAAMADHVAHTRNALCHIDEYKNSVEYEKIEFLKGLWDGTGRNRMNMDKDKKREMTAVDSGIILTGQEMCTADIALFSRVIFLSFTKYTFSNEEKQNYTELKDIEKLGLTHITNELLKHRQEFISQFQKAYKEVNEDFDLLVKKETIEDRLWRNWTITLAAIKIIAPLIEMPNLYKTTLRAAEPRIKEQNEKTKSENEVSNFWEIFEYLSTEGIIEEKYDYNIRTVHELKTDKYEIQKSIQQPLTILYFNPKRILQLYAKHGKTSGQKTLPLATLKYYLKNTTEYLGTKTFKLKQRVSQLQDKSTASKWDNDTVKILLRNIRCYCYEYEKLDLDIETSMEDNSETE